MTDQKNTIVAILLSVIVLIGWQYFFAGPQMEKQQRAAQEAQQQQSQPQTQTQTPGVAPAPGTQTAPGTAPTPGAPTTRPGTAPRESVIAASPRIQIDTPRLRGSIALKGARIDDVSLKDYRETVDPKSPNIKLLSPAGSPDPFYAEFGWVAPAGSTMKLPNADTVWTAATSGTLTHTQPVVLSWDNGAGLIFRRTISVDANYMFTVNDTVENKGADAATIYGYGLISRHGTPPVAGFYILHEGLIGVLGDGKLHEITYSDIAGEPPQTVKSTGGWLGITDKYWAATLIPDQATSMQARFASSKIGALDTFQTDYLLDATTIAPGAKVSSQARLFAGAKEVAVVDGYETQYGIKNFELLIDWGWFYFVTKPMFFALDYFFRWSGNFGIAILIVTVFIKILFFPLANKSYASMARMKAVQPQMLEIRERFSDDKVKQQQAMMDLYKREKINPVSGCLPILIQIPVFFALYKVLFVTIEMRHAPFFGWIRDLSAPDPTTVFNLFGLIPWDPTVVPVLGPFLMLGVWPLIMGVTMFVQMKMNPAPPDPTQKMIFDWMPLFFTFLLASFPAGLVIYWAWNNFLSVLQQGAIMRKHGVKIELFDNIKGMVGKGSTDKKAADKKN
ncbi:MAG TPA: membrane protein insertase YidC [Xanthobacteraceae bacterium]|nr:membrane protein insertase YidC [Xanthobacteraceae bacterium]